MSSISPPPSSSTTNTHRMIRLINKTCQNYGHSCFFATNILRSFSDLHEKWGRPDDVVSHLNILDEMKKRYYIHFFFDLFFAAVLIFFGAYNPFEHYFLSSGLLFFIYHFKLDIDKIYISRNLIFMTQTFDGQIICTPQNNCGISQLSQKN